MSGSHALLRASVDVERRSSGSVLLLAKQFTDVENRLEKMYESLDIAHTGAVPMMHAFYEASSNDFSRLGIGLALVLLFVASLVFRSFLVSVFFLCQSLLGVVVSIGAIGLFGITINSATSVVPLVVLTLGVASSVHVYVDFVRKPDQLETRRQRIHRAVWGNAKGITLATATSCVGLCSLLFVSSPALQQLGAFSSLGLLTTYLFGFSVLPWLLLAVKEPKQGVLLAQLRLYSNALARRVEASGGSGLVLVVLLLLAIPGPLFTGFNEDFVDYFAPENEFREATKRIEEFAHTPYTLDVSIRNGQRGQALDALVYSFVGEVSRELRENPAVVNVRSVTDLLESSAAIFGDEVDITQGVEQRLLLLEFGLEEGESLSPLISDSRDAMRVSVLLNVSGAADIQRVSSEVLSVFSNAMNDCCPETTVTVSGEGLVSADFSVQGSRELVYGVGLSWILVFALISSITRSIRLGVLVVLASIVPLAAGLSLLGVFTGTYGLTSMLVAAVTLGVVIDDVVHFVVRAHYGSVGLRLSSAEAASYAVHRVGPAVIASSLALVLGFMVLLASEFQVNREFGLGVVIVVIGALVASLIAAPKLLVLLLDSPGDLHGCSGEDGSSQGTAASREH
ncbi:MAG: MMPL family transporter [Pseudomonadota bacterium]